MSIIDIDSLVKIAMIEFCDIVVDVYTLGLNELRIILKDKSFVDVWFSLKLEGRYSYHWDRRAIDGSIYRHDNAPHKRWRYVKTFPKHFHNKEEENVIESNISSEPEKALREFLSFIRSKLEENRL